MSGEGLGPGSAPLRRDTLATPLLPTGLKGCPLGVASGTPCHRSGWPAPKRGLGRPSGV